MPAVPPSTPPILAQLVKAHRAFIEKKRVEREYLDWLLQVADEIDARNQWLLYEAFIIDCKLQAEFGKRT